MEKGKTACFLSMPLCNTLLVPYHVDKHVGLLSIHIPGAVAAEVTMLLVVFVCLQPYVSGAFLATTASLRYVSEIGSLFFYLGPQSLPAWDRPNNPPDKSSYYKTLS